VKHGCLGNSRNKLKCIKSELISNVLENVHYTFHNKLFCSLLLRLCLKLVVPPVHSRGFPSVVGRDLLNLRDYTGDEIRYLLWTATDLKERIKKSKEVGKEKLYSLI